MKLVELFIDWSKGEIGLAHILEYIGEIYTLHILKNIYKGIATYAQRAFFHTYYMFPIFVELDWICRQLVGFLTFFFSEKCTSNGPCTYNVLNDIGSLYMTLRSNLSDWWFVNNSSNHSSLHHQKFKHYGLPNKRAPENYFRTALQWLSF